MSIRIILGTAAASALLLASAQAADVAVEEVVVAPVAEPAPTWDGVFGGIHVGYGWTGTTLNRDATVFGPFGPQDFSIGNDPDGVLGGLQLGYNRQYNQFVLGVIGDFSLTGMQDTGVYSGLVNTDFWDTDYEWIATIRGRAGWLLNNDNTLIYGHGGVAFADVSTDIASTRAIVNGVSLGGTETGWVAGAGIESRISDRVSIFAEYSYMDFGGDSWSIVQPGPPPDFTYSTDNDPINAIKIGVNFKLWNPGY